MPVRLNSSGGGSVTLDVPVTASAFTLTIPALSGSVVASNASGDVGIGTSAPGSKLEVANPTATRVLVTETSQTVQAQVACNTAETIFGSFSNHPVLFRTNNTERMRIDTSGNVGIGTSSPAARLHVNGASGSAQVRMGTSAGYYEVNAFDGNPVYMVVNGTNHTSGVIGTQSNTPFAFFTNNAERARITSVGEFLVGTTSTFDVTSGATTQLSGQCAVFAAGSPNTLMSFYNSSQAARVGFIGSNGNSTSYNSGSDYRLKDNVTDISGAAAAVQSLRPVTFTWKVSPETGTFSGFIAHELQGVWPEAVVGEKDAICDDGVTPNYQMVDQSKLVPLLTAALQEALSRIETLEARLAAVEAR